MEGSRVRLVATAHGLVQGVAFRDFVWYHAQRLQLTGYVCNLPDATSVEVCAEGESDALKELLSLLFIGPPAARVTGVEEAWEPFTGEYGDFSTYL